MVSILEAVQPGLVKVSIASHNYERQHLLKQPDQSVKIVFFGMVDLEAIGEFQTQVHQGKH